MKTGGGGRPGRRAGRSTRVPPEAFELALELRRIVQALALHSRELHKSYRLTSPQLWVLKAVVRDGPLRAGELARRLSLTASSLSILLDRMEKRGLVRRVRSRSDRRVVEVRLSATGRALAARAPDPAQGRLLRGLAERSPRELKELLGAVKRIVELMEGPGKETPFYFPG